MAHVVVVGNVNLETTVRVERFPLTYESTRYVPFGINSAVSGVGFNVARALHTLGERVSLAALIADDAAGRLVRATLAAEGLVDRSVLPAAAATPQSVILYDADGARAVHTDLKDVLRLSYPPAAFDTLLADADLVALSNIAYSLPLIGAVQARRLPLATDLHLLRDAADQYHAPLLRSATILFVSGEQLAVPPAAWAETLLGVAAAEIVVIGLGADGAYLAVRRSGLRRQLPAVAPRPIVQTGGAGDALFAAFLHGWLQGADPLRALHAATVFAGYKLGAANSSGGLLSRSALSALLAELPDLS